MTAQTQYESIEDWKSEVRKSSQILLHDTLRFSEPSRDGVVSASLTTWDGRYVFIGAYSTKDNNFGFEKDRGWFHP